MGVLELILIFFEEILSVIFKIKNSIIRNIILCILVLLASCFIVLSIYVLISSLLSSIPWYIKLFLATIILAGLYFFYQVLFNAYHDWKQRSK